MQTINSSRSATLVLLHSRLITLHVSGVKVSFRQTESLQVGKTYTVNTERIWQNQKVSRK